MTRSFPARLDDVSNALSRFDRWLARFGETSFDHQSYYAGALGGRAKSLYYRRPALGILAVAPMIASEAFLPSARRLFGRRQRFPIADAHYAMGFAMLYRVTREPRHLQRARHFADVLEATRCPGYAHACWGYPFDWVTRNGVMRAQTPLITTTPYCYDALVAVYELDGDRRELELARSAAEHAFSAIPERKVSPDASSAGYNPSDTEGGVVNASAYRAALLADAALRFVREDYLHAARRNLAYVLDSQRPDGSWFYATDGVRDFIDHFHTCFVLKALARIDAAMPEERCGAAIASGVRFYTENLFGDDGLPRPFARAPRLTVYKRELYDYAECLNLALLLRGRFRALDERAAAALDDLLDNWQKSDGSFRTRRLIAGWDEVPMHRWAQAQVFRSLCTALSIAADAGCDERRAPPRSEHRRPAARESLH